jgi:predicted  nucleic acid-binding Zn-ribbon protein
MEFGKARRKSIQILAISKFSRGWHMDEKYPELAVELQEVKSRGESNQHRIDKLEIGMEKLNETQISLVKIANSVENIGKSVISMDGKVSKIQESQDALTVKVTEIENRPAKETKKLTDNIKEKLWYLIIGGIAVTILYQVLPNFRW